MRCAAVCVGCYASCFHSSQLTSPDAVHLYAPARDCCQRGGIAENLAPTLQKRPCIPQGAAAGQPTWWYQIVSTRCKLLQAQWQHRRTIDLQCVHCLLLHCCNKWFVFWSLLLDGGVRILGKNGFPLPNSHVCAVIFWVLIRSRSWSIFHQKGQETP